MGKSSLKNQSIQLELFPTGKTEQSLTWRQILSQHTKPQDHILRVCYTKYLQAMKTGDYQDLDEVHKIVASIAKAGQWKKSTSEALKLADENLHDAMIAESISPEELADMSNEELKKAVLEWI